MDERLYLVKEGEIALKGGNRIMFERKLRGNIRSKLKPYQSRMDKSKGRVYVSVEDSCPREQAEKALSTTFGITGWAESERCREKSMEAIMEKTEEILSRNPFSSQGSFKIDVRREDKSFPLDSHAVACALADIVEKYYPSLRVDLKNPDYTLTVEIRNQCFVYTDSRKGIGGLPVGTAGRGMLLLSGGIDSPVAGYTMAKRGLKLDCCYFHAYPYTSEMALEKVKKLASLITPYLQGTRLFVVPFTKGQEYIRDHGVEEEATLMFRAAMMKTAEKLSLLYHDIALVTGEAVSQVASQTLDAMTFTDSMTDMLILRPLCGMDKEEIIKVAKDIDTYDTSILPYEDCCVVFSPKHPVTRPDKKIMKEHFEALHMDALINEAVENTVIYTFSDQGIEEGKSGVRKAEDGEN